MFSVAVCLDGLSLEEDHPGSPTTIPAERMESASYQSFPNTFLVSQIRGILHGLSVPQEMTVPRLTPLLPILSSSELASLFPLPQNLQEIINAAVKQILADAPSLGTYTARDAKFTPRRYLDAAAADLRTTFARDAFISLTALHRAAPATSKGPTPTADPRTHAATLLHCDISELLLTRSLIVSRSAVEPLSAAMDAFRAQSAAAAPSLVALRPLLPSALADATQKDHREDVLDLLRSLAPADRPLVPIDDPDIAAPFLSTSGGSASDKPKRGKGATALPAALPFLPQTLTLLSPALLALLSRTASAAAESAAAQEAAKILDSSASLSLIEREGTRVPTVKGRSTGPDQIITAKWIQELLQRQVEALSGDAAGDEGKAVAAELAPCLLPAARDAYAATLERLLSCEADRRREQAAKEEAEFTAVHRRAAACLAGCSALFGAALQHAQLFAAIDRHVLRTFGPELARFLLRLALLAEGRPPGVVEGQTAAPAAWLEAAASLGNIHLKAVLLPLLETALRPSDAATADAFLSSVEMAAKGLGLIITRPTKKADVTRCAREYELFLRERISELRATARSAEDHAQLLLLLVPMQVAASLKVAVAVPGKALGACLEAMRAAENSAANLKSAGLAPGAWVDALQAYHDAVLAVLSRSGSEEGVTGGIGAGGGTGGPGALGELLGKAMGGRGGQ